MVEECEVTFASSIYVPNEGDPASNIWLVGEAPGADETYEKRPFIGVSGQKLRGALTRAGTPDASVYLTNLCHYRPVDNKFGTILRTKELEDGIEDLAASIRSHQPNVVGALGGWPLYYLTGKHGKKGPGTGIGKWRGSILPCILPGCGTTKVIASYHPAFITRNPEAYPVFDTDIRRIIGDSSFPDLRYPVRELILDPRGRELDRWVNELIESSYLACDIESIKSSTRILCHGFSPRPGTSVVISHSDTDYSRQDAVRAIYASHALKVFHNGAAFDIPMLALNGITVSNYGWDTMTAQHTMWAELPKSLDYLTSIYTRQPYYKTAGRAEIPEDAKGWSEKFDRNALYEYNGTDTSVTAEIYETQLKEVADGPAQWRSRIDYLMSLAAPAMRISLAGMLIDQERLAKIRKAVELKWAIHQYVLDRLTGFRTNVNSYTVMPKILYDKDKWNLPTRKSRDGTLTTDEDAIVSLIAFCQDKLNRMKSGGNAIIHWKVRYEGLKTILVIRGLRKLLSSYVNAKQSPDGRFRGSYKILGTETMRWACAKFIDGTGLNAQTFPREIIELKDYSEIPALAGLMDYIKELAGIDRAEEEEAEDGEATAA